MRNGHRAGKVVGALALLALTGGCLPSGDAWNLELDAAEAGQVTIEFLDVVAINTNDLEEWRNKPVAEYFKGAGTDTGGGDSLRKHAPRLSFSVVAGKINFLETTIAGAQTGLTGGGAAKLTIPLRHPAWAEWLDRQRAVALVVLAKFPNPDARDSEAKKILPLSKACWETKGRTLTVEIQEQRLDPVTPPSKKAAKHKAKLGL